MAQEVQTPEATGTTLVDVKGLKVHFPIKGGIFSRTVAHVKAVDGVDLFVRRGETLGLVGESGCGKSTTGRAILQLIKPTTGSVKLNGTELTTLPPGEIRKKRADMQMVFQDPFGSLSPRFTIGKIIAEPLENFKRGSPKEIYTNCHYIHTPRRYFRPFQFLILRKSPGANASSLKGTCQAR